MKDLVDRSEPMTPDWTSRVVAVDAAALGAVLGRVPLDALKPWHGELATAVDELHRCAGSALSWDIDDPVVALVRGLAVLARGRPPGRSPTAGWLVTSLERSAIGDGEADAEPDEQRPQ